MTTNDKKFKVESLISRINQVLMSEFQYEEDRIETIEMAIQVFHSTPAIKYLTLVDEDSKSKKKETSEGVRRISIQSFHNFIRNQRTQ